MGKKTSNAEKKPREKREARPPKDPSLRNKMYRYRLYPTKNQSDKMEWILRRSKELYNAALEERTAAYRMAGVSVTFKMQSAQLPEIKEDRPEYQEIYAQVLQEVLHRIDKAMQNFFRRVKNGEVPGYPRYKSNSRYHSFTYPQDGFTIIDTPARKAKKELSRLYRKTRNRRQDFLHKTSRRLVDEYGTLVFEDLQIKNMSAKPKPKKDEETGKFVPNGAAAKGGLNKSMLDAAWGTFTRLCASKAEEAGCTVVKVSPRHTTQACSGCGSLVPKDLAVRWHSCPDCGCAMDRDENAARNILLRYKHPETPLVAVKREKKPRPERKTKKSTGAGSVPQPFGEEPASPGDCRSPRL